MIQQFHTKSMFGRQKERHELWMEKYPNREDATPGIPLQGIENVRPETVELYHAPFNREDLPFDPEEIMDHKLPYVD